jgi:hypothetical protein
VSFPRVHARECTWPHAQRPAPRGMKEMGVKKNEFHRVVVVDE